MTAIQRETPHALLGRVAATANSLVFAPTAVTLLTGAGLLVVLDYRIPLVAAALGTLLAGCWVLTRHYPVRSTAHFPVPVANPLGYSDTHLPDVVHR